MSDALTSLGGGRATPAGPTALVDVVLPSGASFPVHAQEVEYLTQLAARYLAENHFANVSDFQDVDRMLLMELMCFRWGTWISQGYDYDLGPVDLDELQKAIRTHSGEVRMVKKQLEIDTVSRNRSRGEDSVSGYLSNLLARAKEFGVMRETQLARALNLFQEMKALLTLHLNCDAVERAEMHMELEDVLAWITDVAIPEFDAVDAHFRRHQQRLWVRSL